MTADGPSQPPQDEGDWIEVGQAPSPSSAAAQAAPPPEENFTAYEGRKPTPPWKLSLYTGAIGLILMALIYVFPELRRLETPWNPSLPTAYILVVLPIFGLLWGIVGLIGKQFAGERHKAWTGLVLSALTVGLAYVVMTTDPARGNERPNDVDQRLQMSPQELRDWRSDKLRQQ